MLAMERPAEKIMGKTREERIEIHERLIVRTASGSLPVLCEACSAGDSILLSPEQASALTGIPARLIYRLVEAGTIHYSETPNGKITLCIKTLLSA
jgi:predicted site-specific integrase-resolvase